MSIVLQATAVSDGIPSQAQSALGYGLSTKGSTSFRQVISSSQHGRQPAAANDKILMLILRYSTLEHTLETNLQGASSVTSLQANVVDMERRLSAVKTNLKHNEVHLSHTERRLQRNAHPRFLHYLQIDREGKVRRLETEVAQIKEQLDEARKSQIQLEKALNVVRQELVAASDCQNRVASARQEMQSIVDQVSSSQGSITLTSLYAQVKDVELELRQDEALLKSLEQVMSQVNVARSMFDQAHSELRRAARDNQAAANEARFDMAFMETNDMYENMLQSDRDRMINLAKQTSLQAGHLLQAAFDAFPMEARVRFPEVTRNVCNAPIPILKGATYINAVVDDMFYGGAYMNDLAAEGTIARDLQIVRYCEAMARSQAASVQTVINQVSTTVKGLEQQDQGLKQSIQSEKLSLFERVRQTHSLQAPIPVVAQAVSVVSLEAPKSDVNITM